MDFSHWLSSFWFNDQLHTNCMRLIIRGPWLNFSLREIGGGTFFALRNKSKNSWCASNCLPVHASLNVTLLSFPWSFDRVNAAQSTWTWARYLKFSFQRPGDPIYFSHLLAHAVLFLETGSPEVLCGWNAATTSNQQFIFRALDEYFFSACRGRWREIFREKASSALGNCVFSATTGSQESKKWLQKHWKNSNQDSWDLINTLSLERPVTNKKK